MRSSGRRALAFALGALSLLAAPAAEARAQGSLFERLGLDKLRLTSIGLGYGPASPAKVEPTHSFALQVDYGEIAPRWHVVFGASYWESTFTRQVTEEFAERLRERIDDPTGDATLDIGRVRVSDVALEMEIRYVPVRSTAALRPYAGVALGAHAINAESAFINDTFVESALDNIATGLTAVAGVNIAPSQRFSLGVQGRYTMLSTLRFGALRALVNYHFAGRGGT